MFHESTMLLSLRNIQDIQSRTANTDYTVFQRVCLNNAHHMATALLQLPWCMLTPCSFRLCYNTPYEHIFAHRDEECSQMSLFSWTCYNWLMITAHFMLTVKRLEAKEPSCSHRVSIIFDRMEQGTVEEQEFSSLDMGFGCHVFSPSEDACLSQLFTSCLLRNIHDLYSCIITLNGGRTRIFQPIYGFKLLYLFYKLRMHA